MPKLSLEVDTESGTISASVDGEAIDGASYVSVYGERGECHFTVETVEKRGGAVHRRVVCASEADPMTPAQRAVIACMESRR